LEYDFLVWRSIAASAMLFSLFLLLGILAADGHAQVTGAVAPPTGGIGHSVTGTVPYIAGTVRSPTGSVLPPTNGLPGSLHNSGSIHPGNGQHHHSHYVPYVPPFVYGIALPYAVDVGAAEEQNNSGADDEDAEYQGGPTVFDRRGSGADSYVPPIDGEYTTTEIADATPDPDPPEPTLLVFKDGHKLEILNYAIVDQTLLDLTPGHARKVALADLDLEATRAQNENRGITFQVPALSQAN
jgi:hypothetical protein